MTQPMKILYIGSLWEGSTCLERMRILETLACQVIPFDTTPWVTAGARWQRSFTSRCHWGAPVNKLNTSVQDFSLTLRKITHVWIDKGQWIYPDTLAQIQSRTSAKLIHYTPDSQFLLNISRHFRSCIPLYDLAVTTKPFEVELYKAARVKQVLLVLQGYDDRFTSFAPTSEERGKFDSDVCFIGHCETHYARILNMARHVAERLRIWGPHWRRYRWFHPWAWNHVVGDGVWGKEYPLALASTKVALGLLSKRIPETTTTRSFEVPATGVFMLAERTDDHLALFSEGVEAEFFSSDEELRDKLSFYLKNDHLRQKIAAAGRERCLRSGYHSRAQLIRALEQVE